MIRALAVVVVLGLAALGAAALYSSAAGGTPEDPRAKVAPAVLADTAGGATAHFLVLLDEQADTRSAAAAARTRGEQGRAVVDALRAQAGSSQPAVRTTLDRLGVSYRAYWIVNAFAVEGDRRAVEALAALPQVRAIELDRAFTVDIERPQPGGETASPSAIEWNVSWIDAPYVWTAGYTGQGTVHANADTGVKWDHAALRDHYRGWNGSTADHNYNWWDAIHADISGNATNPCGFSSATPCDDNGHGTHTTGTAVGDDGASNQVGVAPDAEWIGCRNMDEGVGRPSTYIECLQFFIAPTDLSGSNPDPDKRPHAVGNSYACPPSELCVTNSLQTAVENVRAAGIFMAVSAGNSGSACSTVTDPPGLEDSVITVGATGFMTDVIASYSSRGPVTVDGSNRMKPDVVAPGSGVRSSYPPATYATLSGTSMAAPHVAGAVLLLWSAFPGLSRDVGATEALLESTAVQLTTTQGCGGDSPTDVPNNVYGHGRIDLQAAYEAQSAGTPTPTATATATPTETATPTVTPTPSPDSDGDGCTDAQELGPDPALGGGRDPFNPYDFYDITDATLVVAARDKGVSGFDLSLLIAYGGAQDGAGPNVNGRDYNADTNGNTIDDGPEVDYASIAGPASGPDGGISGFDLSSLVNQGGHSCA